MSDPEALASIAAIAEWGMEAVPRARRPSVRGL
jgi:hypothetical protein